MLFEKGPPDVKSCTDPGQKACHIGIPVNRFHGVPMLVDLCCYLLVAPRTDGGVHGKVGKTLRAPLCYVGLTELMLMFP